MITITLTWHLILLLVFEVIGLIWVFSCDDTQGYFGSDRGWATFAYVFISIVVWLIYGGIVWW